MYTTIFIVLVIFGFIIYSVEKKSKSQPKKKQEEKMKEDSEDQKQEKLKKELDKLIDDIIADWNLAIYDDKIQTPHDGSITFRFENGNTIFMQGRTLIYTTPLQKIEYTLGLSYKSIFVGVLNRMVGIINEGKTGRRQKSYSYSNSTGQTYTSSSNKATSSSPRQRRYDIIMETIKLRKEKLSKMRSNDPERPALENELKAAERKADAIKKELQN